MFKEINNLIQFEEAFPNELACINHFRAIRWPNGMSCVHCGSMERVYDLKMGRHKCGDCKGKFTVRHDTIFGDSKLPLRTWYRAIFLMTSHKKGISSHQLGRDIGVTQKTAWFILHRVREATLMTGYEEPLSGTIEADELFVGARAKWKHADKGTSKGSGYGDKKKVLGLLQRGGDLRLMHMPQGDTQKTSPITAMQRALRSNIRPGSAVHTDEAPHYKWMGNMYAHSLVKHTLGEYVRGDVTTNRIEGAFGHFKRAVHGVYHKVSDEHLDKYLQMFAWRWNRREMGEGGRVNDLLQSTKGRRLTYKRLTRKMEG